LTTQSYDVWVDSYGTAKALTETRLVSEINGKVIAVSPNIRAGGSFKKGDLLVQLEDRDFRFEVDVAASAAAEAEVVYLQEQAQAEFAAQD
jgi:multidrug resistance efflux pump